MKRLLSLAVGLICSCAYAQDTMPTYVQSPGISTSNFTLEAGEIPAWVIPNSARFVGTIPRDGKTTSSTNPASAIGALPVSPQIVPLAPAGNSKPSANSAVFFAPLTLSPQAIDNTKARTSQQWGELIRSMRVTADDLQLQATDAISTAERQRKLTIVKEQLAAIAELERAQKTLDITQKQMAEILRPAFLSSTNERISLRPQAGPAELTLPTVAPAVSRPADVALKGEVDKLRAELDEFKKARQVQDAQVARAKQQRLQTDAEDLERSKAIQKHNAQIAELQFTETTAKANLQKTLKTLQESQDKAAREVEQGAASARAVSEARKAQELALQQQQRDDNVKAASELQRLNKLNQAAASELQAQAAKREAESKASKEREAALAMQQAKLEQGQAGLQRLQSEREALAAQLAQDAQRRDKEKILTDEQIEKARVAKAQLDKLQLEAEQASIALAQKESKTKALAAQEEEIKTNLQIAKAESEKIAQRNSQSSVVANSTADSAGFVMRPQDRLVAATLARWAAQDNYALYWTAPDVPTPSQEWVLANASNPQEAIDMAITALGTSGIKLKLCEHTNRTLSVVKADDACIPKQ